MPSASKSQNRSFRRSLKPGQTDDLIHYEECQDQQKHIDRVGEVYGDAEKEQGIEHQPFTTDRPGEHK